MTTVTLVYPYFRPSNDNSIFRFPPLGLGYIAAYLKQHGTSVNIVDCTFLNTREAFEKIRHSRSSIIGIYSMFSMKDAALKMAANLRNDCEMLVAGGPLPTTNPKDFLEDFDVVAIGEGEETMLELVHCVEEGTSLSKVKDITYKEGNRTEITPPRSFIRDLDTIPFPCRELFDNEAYREYYQQNWGYTITSMITSRGCPFNCDFCSRPVFGEHFRTRSATNIVDEIETIAKHGYERIWFVDDCFTLNRRRLINICDEIIRRGIEIGWECLSRVDTVDREVAEKMKAAGCVRMYFGIESGNDAVLSMMKKQITTQQAEKAIQITKQVGIETGAFFIVGYPGEDENTILDTVKFASALPLDYLSFTLPYPIPGTPLYERVKGRMLVDDWEEPKNLRLIKHKLLFRSPFSEAKLKFAILKAMGQYNLRRYLGNSGYRLVGTPFEQLTDFIFRRL